MSFGKLLAAGKSVAGAGGGFRYKADPRVFLPKFISPKNPFVSASDKDSTAPAMSPVAHSQNPSHPAAEAGTQSATPVRFETVAARAPMWKRFSGAIDAAGGLLHKFNPLKIIGRKRSQSKSMVPRFGKLPVQEEFSLDRVRVVRNDLSDADLEIVSGRERSVTKQPNEDGAWGRLATRVFGTETT
jgi:hypothetical protein